MNDFPYQVLIHESRHISAEAWCRDRLGERWSVTENRAGKWSCFWAGRDNPDRYRYHFANDRDLVLFSLRWSS